MSHASIETIVGDRKSQPHQLIEVLQDIQEVHSYISKEAATAVSGYLGVPLIEVFRAANFYKALSLEPRGKNVITLCTGTACHVRGSNPLLDQAKFLLNLDHDHGGTTKDGLFTVECVNCLGACAIGPIAVLNGVYHSHMTWAKLSSLIASVRKAEDSVPLSFDKISDDGPAPQHRTRNAGSRKREMSQSDRGTDAQD
jgi:NADH:ubiquinone oxidoreductase subunit E